MNTIKTDFHKDGSKTINCNFPRDENGVEYNLHRFIADHRPDLLNEFIDIQGEHGRMVEQAIKMGHAKITEINGIIKIDWVSDKVHEQYCDTIEKSRNLRYLEFWAMYEEFVRDNF